MNKLINRIHNADCFDFFSKIEDNSIDCVLTDPPYGVTACDWDTVPDLEKLWIEFLRIGKPDCQYIIFSQQPFTTDLINSNRKMFKHELIWNRRTSRNFLIGKKTPLKIHENIIIFNKKTKYFPIMRRGIWRGKGGMKKNSTKFGKVKSIYISGSGVLAVASYETKRNFICIEKEKQYYQLSIERYIRASKQILI